MSFFLTNGPQGWSTLHAHATAPQETLGRMSWIGGKQLPCLSKDSQRGRLSQQTIQQQNKRKPKSSGQSIWAQSRDIASEDQQVGKSSSCIGSDGSKTQEQRGGSQSKGIHEETQSRFVASVFWRTQEGAAQIEELNGCACIVPSDILAKPFSHQRGRCNHCVLFEKKKALPTRRMRHLHGQGEWTQGERYVHCVIVEAKPECRSMMDD